MGVGFAWNLCGALTPLAGALPSIPILVHSLGVDRFGLLALAWALIGYAGLFDFGLGRALTKLTAERLAGPRRDSIPSLLATCTAVVIILSCPLALLLRVFAGPLSHYLAAHSRMANIDIYPAVCVIAPAIPFVTASAVLRGHLDGLRRYAGQNVVRAITGTASYVGPAVMTHYTTNLGVLIGVVAATRILAFLGCLYVCIRASMPLPGRLAFVPREIRELARLGGWMTVSNLISPWMTYLDRFIIASLLPLAAVTFYVTPYDMSTKLIILPTALAGVLFPTFSASIYADPQHARSTYAAGLLFLTFLVGIPCLLIGILAKPIMQLWMGPAFAAQSYVVLAILSVGILANTLAMVPFAFIQAGGRPDLTAKLHLLELPVYLGMVIQATRAAGIAGTAASWTIRMVVDCCILVAISRRLMTRHSYYPDAVPAETAS